MKSPSEMLMTALAVLLLGSGAVYAGDATWVAAGGQKVALPAGHEMMFLSDEGGESFDLSELRDGETRTFGEGAKQVTVHRLGDVATIAHGAAGDGKAMEITCDLPNDTCRIVTFDDQPEKVMVVVEKERHCAGGAGDCDDAIDVMVDHLNPGAGQVHAIVRKVECNDAGECTETEDVLGNGPGGIKVIDAAVAGAHGDVMILRGDAPADGQVLLRCPEGDATIRVAEGEAGDSYLCPKHSVPMEKASATTVIRVQREH